MKIFIILLAAAGKEVQICIFPANQGGTSGACHPGRSEPSPLPSPFSGKQGRGIPYPTGSVLPPPLLPRHNLEGRQRKLGGPACLQTLPDPLPKEDFLVSLPCSKFPTAPSSASNLNSSASPYLPRSGRYICMKLYPSQRAFKILSSFHSSKCPPRLALSYLFGFVLEATRVK